MAGQDDNNIGDLTKVKQLTASIRFESEDVRKQVEQMLTRYQDIADILGKTRELTRGELAYAKEYAKTLAQMGQPLGEHVRNLNDSSKAIIAMEQAVSRYASSAEKAERVSARLADTMKGARKQHAFNESRNAAAESGLAQARGKASEYGELHAAVTKAASGGDDSDLRTLLGGEAEGKSKKDLRRLGRGKLKDARTAIGGEGATHTQVSKQLKDDIAARQKGYEISKREVDLSGKRVAQLDSQRKMVGQIKVKNEESAKSSQAMLDAHNKILPKIMGKAFASGDGQPGGGGSGGGGPGGDYGDRRRRGLMGSLGLNLVSDMGIPGISSLARVERYRRMAVDHANSYRRRQMDGAEEGQGEGFLGKAAGMAAGPLGIAAGGLAVVGGFAVNKFRQAMGEAEGMAGPQRTLQGQVGTGRMGAANAAYRQDLTGFGLDMRQAQSALVGLNRSVGGRTAGAQLRDAAALGQTFGQDVGEVGGQAGALMRAGGSSPQQSVKSLEKIMMEGVKAGMDRARITEFTSEVISIQEQILKESGADNAQAIAKSLAQFMGASGKQGQEFTQSAAFQGLMGIDRGMKGFSRGASGPGAGTLYRAFSRGVEGDTPSDRYVSLSEKMEGGIFGGHGKDSAASRVKQVLGQYFQESGAGDLFEKKTQGGKLSADEEKRYKQAQNVVQMRMGPELGVGYGQSKELIKLMENVNQKMGSPEGQQELVSAIEDMKNKTKDPLVALGDKMAQANTSLQRIATNTSSLEAFKSIKDIEIKINEAMSPIIQKGANIFSSAVDEFLRAVKIFSGDDDKSVPEKVGEYIVGDRNKVTASAPKKNDERNTSDRLVSAFLSGGQDDSISSIAMDAMSGAVKSLFGSSAPPVGTTPGGSAFEAGDKPQASAPTSSTDVQSRQLSILDQVNKNIQAQSFLIAQGNEIMKRNGRGGNAGGVVR